MVDASNSALVPNALSADQDHLIGVSVNMPAAHAYLHPAILRHRLGALQVMTEEEEKIANQRIQTTNANTGTTAHSKRADTLALKRKDVSIFGKTFVFKRSAEVGHPLGNLCRHHWPPLRSETLTLNWQAPHITTITLKRKEKDDSTNSEDVDIELAGTTHRQ